MELLVSTLFVSILMAISYSFARAAFMAARIQAVKSDAQAATVMALDVMARELRMAGFSARGAVLPPLRSATAEHIEVASDLNGDGDVEDTNERIAYGYNDDAQQLMRSTGGGSLQPFVRNVPHAGFQLAYFDGTGSKSGGGEARLASSELRGVHRIDLALQVEIPNPDPNRAAPIRSAVATSICLRNQ